jgi:acyl-coenzyme A synthetase/AMP-(fatty) acid ligase
MKTLQSDSLWCVLSAKGSPRNCLFGHAAAVPLVELVHRSALFGRGEELKDRSVLIATQDQLTAALALVELDGLARRIVLCPPDLPFEYLPTIREAAEVDAIVSDVASFVSGAAGGSYDVRHVLQCTSKLVPCKYDRGFSRQTEWVLLTSGTTGMPKLAVHTLASLTGAIERDNPPAAPVVWATFYDIRRYGGLQIFLRALLTQASLVLSSERESTADFLARAGARGVTHISGTPSHWRRALMSSAAHLIAPQYVRLSGEIADQAILSRLQSVFPNARVAHAFASTEAGLAFEVNDGLAGFPASLIGRSGDVEMKVDDGSLRVRSPRTAVRYSGDQNQALKDAHGFVDTGDMLELRGDRYYFVGRRDGIINVGGLKVHPEEVEAVINRHPRVRMSLVRTRKNSVTGALVVADVVLGNETAGANERHSELQHEILQLCRSILPRHKVPVTINIVPALTVDPTGKLARHHA